MATPIALPILKSPHHKRSLYDLRLPMLSSPKVLTTNLYNNFINGINSPSSLQAHKYSFSQKHYSLSPHSPSFKAKVPDVALQRKPNKYLNDNQAQIMDVKIPKFIPAKKSLKQLSIIRAFAANSTQGTVRTYNEDRVSIIVNIAPNPNKKYTYWPKCFFFAIYDGHGGSNCSDYLRDNLHNDLIQNDNFPSNPKLALSAAIHKAETTFCAYSLEGKADHSGSCLIAALIVGNAYQ